MTPSLPEWLTEATEATDTSKGQPNQATRQAPDPHPQIRMTPSLPEWLTEATEASKGQEEKHVNASRPAWPGRLVASSLPACRHTPTHHHLILDLDMMLVQVWCRAARCRPAAT
ncbi:hypothetical protein V495_03059 [Pseudogymnoascus sp. VKM F-4514 (FW-929)]|nr:hypothetical protein V495_03059 [Pseudogymnoascus sp. VKM F-4514 (FW-929)]